MEELVQIWQSGAVRPIWAASGAASVMTDTDLVLLVELFGKDWSDCECGLLDDRPFTAETCVEDLAGVLVLNAVKRIAKNEWGRGAREPISRHFVRD